MPIGGRSIISTAARTGLALAIGVAGNCLPFFLISWGEAHIDSALAAVLMAVMPLATLLLAESGAEEGTLVWAREQTKGRGRQVQAGLVSVSDSLGEAVAYHAAIHHTLAVVVDWVLVEPIQ